MKKLVENWIKLRLHSRQSMVNTFGSIICTIMLIAIFLGIINVLQMVASPNSKLLYGQTLSPKEFVNRYEFKFTKLEDNTIPAGYDTFYVNMQLLHFNWTMRKGLTPFDEQKEPTYLANIVYTDSIFVWNNEVQYGSNDTTVIHHMPKPTFFNPGCWQVQVRASRINKYGEEIWSQYSDSVPFYISDKEKDDIPFDVPIFFNLRFN